ncbi:MAG: alpha/beta hydrolase fold domain-containing protein, partial [Chloroflexi bacterium]|nr:alpha/beta hydrolase fold domain-containing protein [Chloroflexota bacterium]
RAGLLEMASTYLGGADPRAPLASPRFEDFRHLPPLLVVVGTEEMLLDDALGVIRAAARGSVDAMLPIGAGMQHVFPIFGNAVPESDAAVTAIGRWIRGRTHPEAAKGAAHLSSRCAISEDCHGLSHHRQWCRLAVAGRRGFLRAAARSVPWPAPGDRSD